MKTNKTKNTTQKTEGAINNKLSRDTGNIGHTRHRRTTIKAKEQRSKQKGKSIIGNPEIQSTLSTRRNEDKQNKNTIQKTEVAINNKQSRDTGNIEHTRCKRTTIKVKEQQSKQKGKSIIKNPEIQATLDTQDKEGRQSKQMNNTANRKESQ